MKRYLFSWLCILGILVALTGTAQAHPATPPQPTTLVAVHLADADALARFQASGVTAVGRLYGFSNPDLLAVADPAGLQALVAAGLPARVLDAHTAGATYYLAYAAPGRPAPDWADYGRVLLDDGPRALLRTSPAMAERLSAAGVALNRVTLQPTALQPSTAAFPTVVTPDPLVQFMIDQVDSATVSLYDRELAGELPVWVGGQWYTIPTRYTYSGTPIQRATQYYGERLQALGLDVEYHQWGGTTYPNVIGELEGLTNPDDIYIICAHIDDVQNTPGADDNASGSVAVRLAAEILTQYQWGCTLRFALWTGEEQGLLGSAAYAQRAYQQGENILGVLNLDMIAWNTIGSTPIIDLHADSSLPPTLQLAQLMADVVDAYDLNLVPTIIPNGTGASDHASFWDYGYTAILGIEDYGGDFNPYYHGPGDTPANTDLAYFTDYVRASIATLAHMSGCLIPSGLGGVDGHVTASDTGLPIGAATVTAHDAAGHAFPVTTAPTGYYTRTLLSGTYTVTAQHVQYTTAVITGVQVLTDTTTTVDFVLQPRGRLWGYVTDADNGFPLAATLVADDGTTAQSDPLTGYYEMYLDEGSQTVTASATDYFPSSVPVTMISGQDTRQDFALTATVGFVPQPIHATVRLGETTSRPATITNRTAGPYGFSFYEIPGQFIPAPRAAGIQAAWPGPDGFGYSGEAVDFDWIEISGSGTPVPGLGDDSSAGPFAVGFPFPFYGANQTQFYVSSNGFLSFGSGSSTVSNQCPLPSSTTPNNLIALMWDDLYPNYTTGGVYYQTFASCPIGSGPCLVVEYRNWRHYGGSYPFAGTFEVVLHQNGSVLMQFLDSGEEEGSGSTTGIEGNNAAADHGLTYACNQSASLTDGTAVCFAYPGSSGCIAADVPWLGQSPAGGSVPAGGNLNVTLLFTATAAAGVDQPGNYTADLVVNGNPRIRIPVTMTVVTSECVPVEIVQVTPVITDCTVTFSAELTGDPPFLYDWNFGPFGASADPQPTVDFGLSGTYPYTLTVSNCGGLNMDTVSGEVVVTCGPACEPVHDLTFSWWPLAPVTGESVAFIATAGGTEPIAFAWGFGDGAGATGNPVGHSYSTAGDYTVVVTATNCITATARAEAVVTVSWPWSLYLPVLMRNGG